MTWDELLTALDAVQDMEGVEAFRGTLGDFRSESETVSNGANAKIEELEASLADAEARYKDVAAKNYELMVAAADKPAEDTEDEADEELEENPDDFSDIITDEE